MVIMGSIFRELIFFVSSDLSFFEISALFLFSAVVSFEKYSSVSSSILNHRDISCFALVDSQKFAFVTGLPNFSLDQ